MTRKRLVGLVTAIIFQGLILIGMYVSAAMPQWTGTEIRVSTIPVDPRSMFRGHYARLNYAFSRVEIAGRGDNDNLRNGEIVYVGLDKGAEGLHQLSSVSLQKPDQGIFLRGRIEGQNFTDDNTFYRVKYGIEAFFAAEEKSL